jgi:fucose permease
VTNSQSDAAYLGSIYWGAITLGRVIAIFVAIYLTATQMVRIKLVMCIAFSVVMVFIASTNYMNCAISAALFGFAVSSIFPLAMTVLTDYGFAV